MVSYAKAKSMSVYRVYHMSGGGEGCIGSVLFRCVPEP